MEADPLHASLIWKIRYVFHRQGDPHPYYLMVNAGVDAKKVYMRIHHINLQDFNREIVHMEALPEMYIEPKDAIALAKVIVEKLGGEVPSIIEDLYKNNVIITHSEFYAKLNLLLDHTEF